MPGQIIDAGGAALDCSYNRRVISADLASLRAIPKRLVVVQEANKFEPLVAGIAGGLVLASGDWRVDGAAIAGARQDHARKGILEKHDLRPPARCHQGVAADLFHHARKTGP